MKMNLRKRKKKVPDLSNCLEPELPETIVKKELLKTEPFKHERQENTDLPNLLKVQPYQLNLAVLFWYLVISDDSVCYF